MLKITCDKCTEEREAPHRRDPPNPDSDQALGAARDEPTHVGTKTEGEA
jgi:hypothetical protein